LRIDYFLKTFLHGKIGNHAGPAAWIITLSELRYIISVNNRLRSLFKKQDSPNKMKKDGLNYIVKRRIPGSDEGGICCSEPQQGVVV
jgi:hypothetical protein